jgi:hypothetical protein
MYKVSDTARFSLSGLGLPSKGKVVRRAPLDPPSKPAYKQGRVRRAAFSYDPSGRS